MVDGEILRQVLTRVIEEPTWIPAKESVEEEAVLEMAEMGWLIAEPERPSGIGISSRGLDRYHRWGGGLASAA